MRLPKRPNGPPIVRILTLIMLALFCWVAVVAAGIAIAQASIAAASIAMGV